MVLSGLPATAEFYKYTDEKGVVRFTDDLSQVPENQREKVAQFSDTETASESSGSSDTAAGGRQTGPVTTPDPAQKIATQDDDMKSIENNEKRLNAMRDELGKEYTSLVEEEKKLKSEQGLTASQYKAKEIQARRDEFQKRKEQYGEKRKQYEAELKVHEGRVDQMNKNTTPPPSPSKE
jgi:chromosome segregation ATPase